MLHGDEAAAPPPPASGATSSVASTAGTALAREAVPAPADSPRSGIVPLSPVSLAAIVESEVQLEWHDAVALVLQLTDECLESGARGSLPATLREIWLESTGRLRVKFDAAGTESIVRGLGHVLTQLLSGRPVPAGLRLIGSQAVAEVPSIESVEDLRERLIQFERPNRSRKLVDLYNRAFPSAAKIDKVPAPVPVAPPPPKPPQPEVVAKPPTLLERIVSVPALKQLLTDRRTLLAVLALAAGAVPVIVIAMLTGGPAGPASSQPLSAPSSVAAPAEAQPDVPSANAAAAPAGESAQSQRAGVLPLPRANATARTDTAPPSETARTGPVGADGKAPSVPQTSGRAPARTSVSNSPRASAPSVSTDRAVVRTEPPPVDDRVYSSADTDVVEPILTRPFLPQPTPAELATRPHGVLDLVIDKDGFVEFVRLKSPVNLYRERWWVSVAKSWRFRPAMKDGLPVRYRKEIVITDFPDAAQN